ncbi:sensor histidine kinase [Paenibacillus shirakamiensis]|nr:sensor histidine kinase [Paenibacillus shirakamiensis]
MISITFGYYCYQISSKQIVNKVSLTNLGVVNEIRNNMTSMQRNISDWITVFSLAPEIQESLVTKNRVSKRLQTSLYLGQTASIMNQMLFSKNFDYLALYGAEDYPIFQEATDGSNGSGSLKQIQLTEIYQYALKKNGASYWFSLNDSSTLFIQNNRNEKIGMTRIVRDIHNGNHIGFVFTGINLKTIKEQYLRNLYDDQHGILILDEKGSTLLQAGMEAISMNSSSLSISNLLHTYESGDAITKVHGKNMLVTYSAINENGWRVVYLVPLSLLTKELSSIKTFVFIMIVACLLLSLPFMMVLTRIITSPIKNLVYSMERFQNGHFDERVDIKYRDEIGHLSRGYNKMVKNIKKLVDEVYVLELKEKEAELKALQSQINPHFLYNTLDMIFWEAESAGQSQISEMIIHLSRLFRLNLNKGKSMTNLARESEMLELYLSLQKMRFKDSLTYQINISSELNPYVIMKLILQPFIENALVHGIEQKRGGGTISVSGELIGSRMLFQIKDSGVGMSEETIQQLLMEQPASNINTDNDTSGYAIHNIIARLKYYYNDNYQLRFISSMGQGTTVELNLPAIRESKEGI